MKKTILLLSALMLFTGCSSADSAAEETDVFTAAMNVGASDNTQITTAPEQSILYDTWKGVPEDNWGINPFSFKGTDEPANDVRRNGAVVFRNDVLVSDEPPMYMKGNIFHCDDGTELFISNDQGLIILEKCDVSQLCSGDCVEIATDLIMESDPPIIYPASVMFIEPFDDTIMPENVLKILSGLDKMGYHTDFVPVMTEPAAIEENSVIFSRDRQSDEQQLMHLRGLYFQCSDGTDLFITDDASPVILLDCDLSALESGDCIEVVTDGVMESYPMQCCPDEVIYVSAASENTISDKTLDILAEVEGMGYHTPITAEGCDNDLIVTTITERPPTDRQVTAEEFEEELGFRFNIPEGAEVCEYRIDYSSPNMPVGFVGFYHDGILWNATVMSTNRSYYRDDLFEPYKSEYDELNFVPENGQVIKARGAEPDVLRYFLIHYHSDTINDAYMFNAYWFLEDEGLELTLQSYSEQPVHEVPVEVFGE